MTCMRRVLVLSLLLFAVPLLAATRKASSAGVPSDGTVSGTLTVNGTKFPLTHVYGRKREAWPDDAKDLGEKDVPSCGVVDIIMTNVALPEATIAAILQRDYHGSEKIRGVRLLIDAAADKWEPLFLLAEGSVRGYGETQSSADIEGGRRFHGKVACKNEDVTQVRMFDLTFDTAMKVQYARTEAENAERIPDGQLADEFLRMMPGQWKIERWMGLGCFTASGTLVVGERVSPRAFRGVFHITTSKDEQVDEDVTITLVGSKVHFEGGKVSVPESIWIRDVLDLDVWKNLLIGNSTTDFVVLRK